MLSVGADAQMVVASAKRHSLDCAARKYFAHRSRKLEDEVHELYERLVACASALDKGNDRRAVIERIDKIAFAKTPRTFKP